MPSWSYWELLTWNFPKLFYGVIFICVNFQMALVSLKNIKYIFSYKFLTTAGSG